MDQYLTKVFKSGNSQAIRLPQRFRLKEDRVFIRQAGKSLIITPLPDNWDGFLLDCEPLSDDFSTTGTLPKDVERNSL